MIKPPGERESEKPIPPELYRALGDAATALGQAIRGAAEIGNKEVVIDMSQQLRFVVNAITWEFSTMKKPELKNKEWTPRARVDQNGLK